MDSATFLYITVNMPSFNTRSNK